MVWKGFQVSILTSNLVNAEVYDFETNPIFATIKL